MPSRQEQWWTSSRDTTGATCLPYTLKVQNTHTLFFLSLSSSSQIFKLLYQIQAEKQVLSLSLSVFMLHSWSHYSVFYLNRLKMRAAVKTEGARLLSDREDIRDAAQRGTLGEIRAEEIKQKRCLSDVAVFSAQGRDERGRRGREECN